MLFTSAKKEILKDSVLCFQKLVTVVMDITDVTVPLTDITDVAGVTDVADVTDVTDITDIAGFYRIFLGSQRGGPEFFPKMGTLNFHAFGKIPY